MITDFTLDLDQLLDDDRDGIDEYFGWDGHIFIQQADYLDKINHSRYCMCGIKLEPHARSLHGLINDERVLPAINIWRKNRYAGMTLQEFLKKTLNDH